MPQKDAPTIPIAPGPATTAAYMDYLARNLIRTAQHHREHCGPDCNVSLRSLLEVAVRAGLTISEEDKQFFQ